MEDKHIIKFWLALGLMVAIFIVAVSVRVHAYDEIPLEFNWIYKKNGDSSVYTWNNGYAYNVEGLNYIGMECGFPVPHYAGDGQYSLYFHFKFTCDQDPKPLFRMQISPYDSSLSLYPNTSMSNYLVNQLGQSDLFGEINQYNANLKNYWGTFRWMSKSTCNFQWVCMREKSPDYSNQYTYSVIGIMDLRLMEEDEMSPFRLGIEVANAQSYSTFTVYNVDMGISAMDSSSTWALYDIFNKLEDIETVLNTIDGSAYSMASTLFRIEDILLNLELGDNLSITRLTAILNSLNAQNESLFDEETDEDLTSWAERVSEFESQNQFMHSLENDLIGTIEEFTFPVFDYSSDANSLFSGFFDNEIIILLTTVSLALAIVFCILL